MGYDGPQHTTYQFTGKMKLTLKAQITTVADDSLEYVLQRIHMKYQALFSSKDKSKNNKSVVCCNLVDSLRIKNHNKISRFGKSIGMYR